MGQARIQTKEIKVKQVKYRICRDCLIEFRNQI